ncbi:MAG TPA: hypothetical protein VFY12_02880 [Arenimonas sp.]|nr:hypothetical protein [Arenimonas sp.]
MTVCPIAVAVGCRRCPVFSVCPLKSLLGDQPPAGSPPDAAPPKAKQAAKRRKRKR